MRELKCSEFVCDLFDTCLYCGQCEKCKIPRCEICKLKKSCERYKKKRKNVY